MELATEVEPGHHQAWSVMLEEVRASVSHAHVDVFWWGNILNIADIDNSSPWHGSDMSPGKLKETSDGLVFVLFLSQNIPLKGAREH